MKKSVLICSFLLGGLYLTLSSNSAGPASAGNGIRNGGPNATGTCASCHSGGSGSTTITIDLKEKASGAAADGRYKPGVVYTVTLSGNNPNLAFFGFQLTAARSNSQQAGSFGNLGADKHISNLSGLQVVEHSTSLAKTGGQYQASFDWTAPAAGNGTVTFYGIINGVNNDGSIGGDRSSTPATLALTEAQGTAISTLDLGSELQCWPNPARDVVHFRSATAGKGKYQVRVLDMTGRTLLQQAYTQAGGSLEIQVAVATLPAGNYLLELSSGNKALYRRFVK